jgi:Zn-dependent peptidase ImmA (M78 family)
MNEKRRLAIEKIAEHIRTKCNVSDYGFHDLFEAAEKIGYRVIRYPLGRDSFLGFALIKDEDRIVFSNSSVILSREIFSIAHEIGHQKLHLAVDGRIIIKDDDFNERDESEIEANFFAACLLMPREKVEKFIRLELNEKAVDIWNGLDIARIQTAFSVSYDMAIIRLKTLDLLNDALLEKLKMAKAQQTTAKLLKAIQGNVDLCLPAEVKKVPAEYLEWLISNYNDKLIPLKSLEVALNYVDLTATDFTSSIEETKEEESLEDLVEELD